MVKRFPPDATAVDLTYAHSPPSEVNFLHLMQDTRVDVLLLTKRLRCARDQCLDIVDNLADVVGYPSSGV
jgi:hypothetical protein